MPTHRERILQALNFQTPDHLPKDLGGMRSTGISILAEIAPEEIITMYRATSKNL